MSKINRLLQITLAELIPGSIKDPRIGRASIISVTQVKASPDLQHAKVYLSIVADDPHSQREIVAALAHARGFLRIELGRRVRLRSIPELHFELDETIESAAKIEKILREIASENEPHE